MAIYRIARTSAVTTSGNVAADVAVSSGCRPKLMEVQVVLGAATASTYGLNRPSAIGTRTSPVALAGEDPADPAPTGIRLVDAAVAFSAEPTLASADLCLVALPATIGTGMIWTFPKGLVLDVSKSIALVNRATNANSVLVGWVCDF